MKNALKPNEWKGEVIRTLIIEYGMSQSEAEYNADKAFEEFYDSGESPDGAILGLDVEFKD